MTRAHTPRAIAALTLGAALLLAACGNGDPGTDPTASPTPEPTTAEPTTPEPTEEPTTLSEQDQHIQEAKDTVLTYYATVDEVGHRGFEDWEVLQPYWGHPDISNPQSSLYQDALEAGQYTEGDTVITSITVLEYTPDPTSSGGEQVRMEFCTDTRDVTMLDADGTPTEFATPGPDTFVTELKLQHINGERWTFIKRDPRLEEPC